MHAKKSDISVLLNIALCGRTVRDLALEESVIEIQENRPQNYCDVKIFEDGENSVSGAEIDCIIHTAAYNDKRQKQICLSQILNMDCVPMKTKKE